MHSGPLNTLLLSNSGTNEVPVHDVEYLLKKTIEVKHFVLWRTQV